MTDFKLLKIIILIIIFIYCNWVFTRWQSFLTHIQELEAVLLKFTSGGIHEKHVVATWTWEPSQHLFKDTGKPRNKTCVEVAGRRTFRTLTSSQQSGIKSKYINTHITTIPNTQYTSNQYTTHYSVYQNLVHNTTNLVPQLPLPPIHSTSISFTISTSCIRCYYISHTTTTTMHFQIQAFQGTLHGPVESEEGIGLLQSGGNSLLVDTT